MKFNKDLFKKLRNQYGYSMQDLGELLGCSTPIIHYYESGQEMPGRDMLWKIAYFFDYYMEDFLIIEEMDKPYIDF